MHIMHHSLTKLSMIKKSGTYDQKGVREVTNRKVSGHNSEAGIRGEIHNNYHKCFQRCKEKHATKNEQMGELIRDSETIKTEPNSSILK